MQTLKILRDFSIWTFNSTCGMFVTALIFAKYDQNDNISLYWEQFKVIFFPFVIVSNSLVFYD